MKFPTKNVNSDLSLAEQGIPENSLLLPKQNDFMWTRKGLSAVASLARRVLAWAACSGELQAARDIVILCCCLLPALNDTTATIATPFLPLCLGTVRFFHRSLYFYGGKLLCSSSSSRRLRPSLVSVVTGRQISALFNPKRDTGQSNRYIFVLPFPYPCESFFPWINTFLSDCIGLHNILFVCFEHFSPGYFLCTDLFDLKFKSLKNSLMLFIREAN